MVNITEEELLRQLNDQKIREYAPAIAFSAIVVFFGVLGNAFSVAYYGFKVPRTTTNVIITALSTVDLITCIVLSDEIIELCLTLTFKNVGGCKAMYFFNHTFVLSSGFLLLLVTFDRYRRICFPFRRQISVNAVKVWFFLIVTVAMALSVREWVITDVVRVNIFDSANDANVTAFYCTHSKADSLQTTIRVFQIIDMLVFVTGMASLIIVYSFISKKLWKTRKRLNRDDSETTITEFSTSRNSLKSLKNKTFCPNVNQSANGSFTFTHGSTPTSPTGNTAHGVFKREQDGLHRDNKSHITTSAIAGNQSDIDITVVTDRPGNTEQGRDKTSTVIYHGVPEKQDRKKHNEVTKVDRKVTFMVLVMTIAFSISFIPYFIVNVGIKPKSSSSDQEFSAGIQTALRSYMLHNAVNPYIIGLFNSNFRAFVKTFVCQVRAICQK